MQLFLLLISFILGGLFGGGAVYLLFQRRRQIADELKGISLEAMRQNNEVFLQLAQESMEKFQERASGELDKKREAISHLVEPVHKSLEKFDLRVEQLEKARATAYTSLQSQIQQLMEVQGLLGKETKNLVKALRKPQVRGRWGEIQLRRVVELAGMMEYCDFFEQVSKSHDEGRVRPDLLVKLPGDKNIIIDAKAPLEAYLEAIECEEEDQRRIKMEGHARQLRAHVTHLGRKAYWEKFQPSPEFVVLFLPGEPFFSAALEHDPSLIEMGVEQRVLIATPTTLIALLRAVAFGWRNEQISQNAEEISQMGRELYKRISDLGGHFSKVGKSLESAVSAYNRSVGSLEARVLPSARKFGELQSKQEKLEPLEPIEMQARALTAKELHSSHDDAKSAS